MAVNRGYKPAEQVIMDDYFEAPLDLLGVALQGAQGQQDAANAMLSTIGETQFKHLSGDRKYAESVYDEIFDNVDNLAEGAMGDGDLRSVRADIDAYSRDVKRRFRPEGDIGKMISNHATATAYMKQIDEMATKEIGKGGITAQKAEALKRKVLAEYDAQGGIGAGGPNGYLGFNTTDAAIGVDLIAKANEITKGFAADSEKNVARTKDGKIVNGARWKSNGRYLEKTSTGVKEVSANDVFNYNMGALVEDKALMADLQQQYELGLSPYNPYDYRLKDSNGELVLNDEGNAQYDPNHPIVKTSHLMGNKFGFTEIEFDHDIKVHDYALANYRSSLRQKEAVSKSQIAIFDGTAIDKTIKPKDVKTILKANDAALTSSRARLKAINKELSEEGGSWLTDAFGMKRWQEPISDAERAALQLEKNNLIKEVRKIENTAKAQKRTLDNLAKQGGFDVNKELAKVNKSRAKNGEKPITMATFEGILNGTIDKSTAAEFEKNVKAGVTYDESGVPMSTQAYTKKDYRSINTAINAYNKAQNKASKTGLSVSAQEIVTTPGSTLHNMATAIAKQIANGNLNFVNNLGQSFNNKEFSKQLIEGKAKMVQLFNSEDGLPQWKITMLDKKGNPSSVIGHVPGVENSTIYKDMAVAFRDAATNPGISIAKASKLRKQADLIDGREAQASSANGVPNGYGTYQDQVLNLNLGEYKKGDVSPAVYLPDGMSVTFSANGDGSTYFPVLSIVDENGVAQPVLRSELESPYPINTTPADFVAWVVANNPKLRSQPNR